MGKKVIFVGWINKGKPADCGETMKNQLCIEKQQKVILQKQNNIKEECNMTHMGRKKKMMKPKVTQEDIM